MASNLVEREVTSCGRVVIRDIVDEIKNQSEPVIVIPSFDPARRKKFESIVALSNGHDSTYELIGGLIEQEDTARLAKKLRDKGYLPERPTYLPKIHAYKLPTFLPALCELWERLDPARPFYETFKLASQVGSLITYLPNEKRLPKKIEELYQKGDYRGVFEKLVNAEYSEATERYVFTRKAARKMRNGDGHGKGNEGNGGSEIKRLFIDSHLKKAAFN